MRRMVGTLSCLALAVVSCQLPWMPVRDLPAVSATPAGVDKTAPADPFLAHAIAYLEARTSGLTRLENRRVAAAIASEARRQGLDPELVMAVIHIESRGNNFAVSPVGAMGLMQIMPATGEDLAGMLGIRWRGPAMLFDPLINVRFGVTYLRQLESRYGSLSTALAAYNWGPGHIDRRLRRGTALPVVYARSVLDVYSPATATGRD